MSRRAKEEAERKERQERQVKAEATRAKKKAEELKKKVCIVYNKIYPNCLSNGLHFHTEL